ncbi:hypothetical protein CBF23_003300 [Marinomonas agarivorans]|nr:hypothetical protein CBF23_003300 [Marinomonas agarivorans]
MDSQAIIDRLKISYKTKSDRELADLLKLPQGTISNWKKRETIPYKEICNSYINTGTSVEWLLTGKGNQKEVSSEYLNVPEYKIEASAGHGSLVEEETPSQYIAIKKTTLAANGVNTSNLMIIYAKGDSMEPTFNSGDPLFIDRTCHEVLPDGGIYVFNFGGDLFVKRLQSSFNGDLLVISDNPKYQQMTIQKSDLEQINIVGRVAIYGRICA